MLISDWSADVCSSDLVGLGGVALDCGDALPDVIGRAERGQPAVAQPAAAPQLRRSDPAEPDLEPVLRGKGLHAGALVAVESAVVVHDLAVPEATQQAQRPVEARRPLRPPPAERPPLAGLARAEAEPHRSA